MPEPPPPGRGRPGPQRVRPPRLRRQQRGNSPSYLVPRDADGTVRQRHERQPARRCARDARRNPHHADQRKRSHRQRRQRRGHRRRPGAFRPTSQASTPSLASPRVSGSSMRPRATESTRSPPGGPTPKCSPPERENNVTSWPAWHPCSGSANQAQALTRAGRRLHQVPHPRPATLRHRPIMPPTTARRRRHLTCDQGVGVVVRPCSPRVPPFLDEAQQSADGVGGEQDNPEDDAVVNLPNHLYTGLLRRQSAHQAAAPTPGRATVRVDITEKLARAPNK